MMGMDELLWLRLFAGGFGSGIDLTAVVAFLVFGVVAFLAPVVGYEPRRPGVMASLFLLIGYFGVSLIQLIVQWTQLLDKQSNSFGKSTESTLHVIFAFALLKMVLFLASLIAFAVGLMTMRVRRPPVAPDRDDDRDRDERTSYRR